MTQAKLFHVTPAANLGSIMLHGVSKSFARSLPPFCWYVAAVEVPWAIAHCSLRHKVEIEHVRVLAVSVLWEEMRLTRWRGRYKTDATFHPIYSLTAEEALAWTPEQIAALTSLTY